jgi:hypothetical protein
VGIQPHDTPSEVYADEGEVIVEGPAGLALSLTPEAAVETSERLLKGAMKAIGQKVKAGTHPHRRPLSAPKDDGE